MYVFRSDYLQKTKRNEKEHVFFQTDMLRSVSQK